MHEVKPRKDTTPEQAEIELDRVHEVVNKMDEIAYPLLGSLGWIAKQEPFGGWGFVMGKEFAHIEAGDLFSKGVDALALDCCKQILKCEVNSAEYWSKMINYYSEVLDQRREEQAQLNQIVDNLAKRLSDLMTEHPEGVF